MKVSIVTSVPLAPPWDQGDKNLAYMLASSLPDIHFRLLTTTKSTTNYAPHLESVPVFRNGAPTLWQKARVYRWLLSQNHSAALYHLIYRPLKLSTRLIRTLPEFKRVPTIHTLPATSDDIHLDRDLFFSDQFVAISKFGRRRLQNLGIEPVRYIPPGIHLQPWIDISACGDQLIDRLGLSNKKLVLFPGHYGPGQGADLLVSALPLILEQVPDCHIILACRIRSQYDRERENILKQILHEAGYAQFVSFYNTIQDIRPYIGASDLVALPLQSMRDKLDIPTTLLEAMAAAKPILISDIPPMNELVSDHPHLENQVGIKFPAGDILSLATGISQILTDDPLRLRMGRNAQEFVRRHYDISRVAQRYQSLYQEIAT